ncbi:MAG TPA: hypothetical protein VN040_14930 [Pseudosphingobacterium sp.]|nr:hypothetical protein [Pseudosphingobacterium sp.]
MNIANTQRLMNDEEKQRCTGSTFKDRHELLQYLLDRRILLIVDWKGEEQEFDIGSFLQQRASILEPGAALDINSAYNKMHVEIAAGHLHPGDTVPFLLKVFCKQLKSASLGVVLLNLGNDNYYIGVARLQDMKQLTANAADFWQYLAYGAKTGEVLYTVNCSCGGMNVWQLKRGVLLTDDYCEHCGKELFDKEGKPSMPVIKDYI